MLILNVYEIDFLVPSWFVWVLLVLLFDKIRERRALFFLLWKKPECWNSYKCVSKTNGEGRCQAFFFGWSNNFWLLCGFLWTSLIMSWDIWGLMIQWTSLWVQDANRQSQALCASVVSASLITWAELFGIMCSGRGRKYIPANITSGTLGKKGIFYSVMSSSVSSLKPSASCSSDDETVPRLQIPNALVFIKKRIISFI